MKGKYVADEPRPISSEDGLSKVLGDSRIPPRHDPAGLLRGLLRGGRGSVPEMPSRPGRSVRPAGRRPHRAAVGDPDAPRPARMVRAILGHGKGRSTPAQVRGRATADGTAGGGRGGSMESGRRRRGAARAGAGPRRASQATRLRPGDPDHGSGFSPSADTLARGSRENTQHVASIRPRTARSPDQRRRRLHARRTVPGRADRREMDRPGGRRRDHRFDACGLRGGAIRCRRSGGLGSYGRPRTLIALGPR